MKDIKCLTINYLTFSVVHLLHSTVLQFRLHSYGYSPYVVSCIALGSVCPIFEKTYRKGASDLESTNLCHTSEGRYPVAL